MTDLDAPRSAYLLAVADDELVSGHRASHWTGVAPSLEEDLAFATIAQDEINHADVWYQVLLGPGADRAAIDALGLGRQPDQYRHAVVCERPPRDFAYTLARHWLYDHFDTVRLDALSGSSDREVAAVARKLLHEERYHLEHADHWFWRIVRGGDEARERFREGLDRVWPEALWLFEPVPGEDEAAAAGLVAGPASAQLDRWLEVVGPMLEDAELSSSAVGDLADMPQGLLLEAPDGLFAEPGGRHGRHTADWDEAWEEMTALYRGHQGASW